MLFKRQLRFCVENGRDKVPFIFFYYYEVASDNFVEPGRLE